jgi:hypothetical protein
MVRTTGLTLAVGLSLPLLAFAAADMPPGKASDRGATAPFVVERPGCGRVSTHLRPPVVSERIYPLVLHEIDGRMPGPIASEVHRLGAGRRHLKVSESISGDRFTGWENRKRDTQFRHERFKYLVLDVAPDTTYRLGARLIPQAKSDIRGGRYWEPVVWSEVRERCR